MKLYQLQTLIRDVTGAHYTLAGGCVRDTCMGATPKDYDAVLCLGPSVDEATAFEIIERHVKEFRRKLDAYVEVYMAYGIGDVPNGFTERIYCCGKVTLCDGTQIDLLLDRAPTIGDAVAHYDCNMNQVYLLDDGTGASQPFPDVLVFNPTRTTRTTCPQRDVYMQDKFTTLTANKVV